MVSPIILSFALSVMIEYFSIVAPLVLEGRLHLKETLSASKEYAVKFNTGPGSEI